MTTPPSSKNHKTQTLITTPDVSLAWARQRERVHTLLVALLLLQATAAPAALYATVKYFNSSPSLMLSLAGALTLTLLGKLALSRGDHATVLPGTRVKHALARLVAWKILSEDKVTYVLDPVLTDMQVEYLDAVMRKSRRDIITAQLKGYFCFFTESVALSLTSVLSPIKSKRRPR